MELATVKRPLAPVKHHLYSQFARPRGPLGAMAGRIMSTRGSNVERNRWLVSLLDLEPGHRVLEIGPGPGVALADVVAVARTVIAVDHSSRMLAQARRRNQRAAKSGQLRLIHGSAEDLPDGLGLFDRIYTMNVWQFWRDQEAVLGHLSGRLAPEGLLAIGFQPRTPGADASHTDAARRCVEDQLASVGLVDLAADTLDLEPAPVMAVIGRRPSAEPGS